MVTGHLQFDGQTFKSSKKNRKNYLWIVLVVAAVLLLLGAIVAWLVLNPSKGGKPEAACFLLIDRSGSVSQSVVTLEAYQEMSNRGIEGCASHSALMMIASYGQRGSAIEYAKNPGADTATGARQFKLFRSKARTNKKGEKQVIKESAAAQTAVADILSNPGGESPGSDLLSAIDQAATALHAVAKEEGVESMYLVILGDGMQISSAYSCQSLSDDGTAQEFVDDALDAEGEPDLSGIRVSFGGVKTGQKPDGTSLNSSEEWIETTAEDFWTLYVAQSGGFMCEYAQDLTVVPKDC